MGNLCPSYHTTANNVCIRAQNIRSVFVHATRPVQVMEVYACKLG